MPETSSGVSRRALFGLGLARVGERFASGPPAPPAPPAPRLEDVAARWARRRADAEGHPLWRPATARLAELAPGAGGGVVRSTFGPQLEPDGRGAVERLFGAVPSGGVVALTAWSHGAVARLLRLAAGADPLPPHLPGPFAWGRRERLRQLLDHFSDEVAYHRGELALDAASVEEALATLADAVPAIGAALEVRDSARPPMAEVVERHAEPGPAGIRVPVPYLAVLARAR